MRITLNILAFTANCEYVTQAFLSVHTSSLTLNFILVPRAHDPFGLRQGSRPLAGTLPEVSILGADQKDRGLWGREWLNLKVFQ